MIARNLWLTSMLVVSASCTPHHRGQRLVIDIPPATGTPANGRDLLRKLALDDPIGPTASPRAALATRIAPPPFRLENAGDENTRRAVQCLTAAVYYEARSEPLDGQRAVAQVVLNRVRDRAFPDSICKVVYQRPAHGTGCQFSFACDGSTGRPIEPRAWAMASRVAEGALSGSVFAPIGSATFYHTTAVLPWWAPSLTRIGLVGSHVFYRWGDSLGGALSFRQAYSGDEAFTPSAAPMPDADAPRFSPSNYSSKETEQGVVVHRAAVPLERKVAVLRTEFGVTVHYGVGVNTGPSQTSPAGAEVASVSPAT